MVIFTTYKSWDDPPSRDYGMDIGDSWRGRMFFVAGQFLQFQQGFHYSIILVVNFGGVSLSSEILLGLFWMITGIFI